MKCSQINKVWGYNHYKILTTRNEYFDERKVKYGCTNCHKEVKFNDIVLDHSDWSKSRGNIYCSYKCLVADEI